MDKHCSTCGEPCAAHHKNGVATAIDISKARLHFTDGRVEDYSDQKLAFAVWLALPKGVRAAFRGANDNRPVYPWSHVDV